MTDEGTIQDCITEDRLGEAEATGGALSEAKKAGKQNWRSAELLPMECKIAGCDTTMRKV